MKDDLLKSILDDEFLGVLAKSADLYKIGSNSVLDPMEIMIGLKVVPRAVMSMLISELEPMAINSHKDIHLPFGKMAYVSANKNSADNYTGSVYDDNKLVYDFKNRSIPGLALILLSTFELYNMEDLAKPKNVEEDLDRKVQKLIDERMELHSLVNRVVEDKMAQREAIHKLMMAKLNEAMKAPNISSPIVTNVPSIATDIPPPPIVSKPLEVKPSDITKKEDAPKKGSPLKGFLERKKKPRQYDVEIAKSESANCPDCGQVIYGMGVFSCCICYGPDQNRKIWLKNSDDGIKLKFSRSWSPENIEMLLEVLRGRNGKN